MSELNDKPIVIGLAGGIGSGKSQVAAEMERAGCLVLDADAMAHELLDSEALHEPLEELLGREVFDAKGRIDRRAVASLVFGTPVLRNTLELLLHPPITQQIEQAIVTAPADIRGIVIDAPLLFEAGLEKRCDTVIFIDSPRETRFERVKSARGWAEEDLTLREAAQEELDAKRERSHYVLVNAGSREALDQQVRALLDRLAPTRTP